MSNKIERKRLIALGDNNAEHHFIVKDSLNFGYRRHMLHVELEKDAEGYTMLSCKGVKYPVEIVSQKQNSYELLVNGVSYSFSVETPFSLKRKRMLATQTKSSKVEIIKAPMPGKVLNVMVEEGQAINGGEALLVLEAMKMQNTLIASAKGIVKKVRTKIGSTVGKNDLLIEISKI
jgi:glutaconyl-CoA/methylmalonyl-CoA decarboxylase subunit gamma